MARRSSFDYAEPDVPEQYVPDLYGTKAPIKPVDRPVEPRKLFDITQEIVIGTIIEGGTGNMTPRQAAFATICEMPIVPDATFRFPNEDGSINVVHITVNEAPSG